MIDRFARYAVPAIALIAFFWWQALILNSTFMLFRSNLWLVAFFGLIGYGVYLAWATDEFPVVPATASVAAFVALLVTGGYTAPAAVWSTAQTATVAQPTYTVRPPLEVAHNQTASHVTVNGGAPGESTYVATADRFSSLVPSRDPFGGYSEVVWQQVGPSGQSTAANCAFSAKARLSGLFFANLEWQVVKAVGLGTNIEQDDVFGYCADGVPYVVVPTTTWSGIMPVIEVPKAVAVLNGQTGDIAVYDNLSSGQIPGPVYPMHLAKAQWEASRASGSMWEGVIGSVGFEHTGTDTKDPNFGNSSEFVLARADGSGVDFVTPLTLKGQSSAISAVGVVSASTFKAGALNPLSIQRLEHPRQSNSAVASRIKADYSDLGWASGLSVFEIAPVGPDQWIATVGNAQTVKYRIHLNPDSTSCLYDTSGTKLRCAGSTAPVAPGTQTAPTGDLSTLSNADLAKLAKQVADETAKRLESQR